MLLSGAGLLGPPGGCYVGLGDDDGAATQAADDDGTGGGPGGSAGDDDSGTGGEAACERQRPSATFLRRLTPFEYQRSVAVIFGADLPDVVAGFPADPIVASFDNNAETAVIDDRRVEAWRDAAETLASVITTDPTRRAALFDCDTTTAPPDASCTEAFLRRVGRIAWRRALSDDEVESLLALAGSASTDPDPWRGVGLLIEALLQSPHFLFRVEVGETDPTQDDARRLTGVEVATRLAFLVLASTPSESLLDLADAGGLDSADEVEAAARTLLADPGAASAQRRFHAQRLQLPLLDAATRDTGEFPLWSPELRTSMHDATLALVESFAQDPDADMRDLLTADFGFVDARLAALYGVDAPGEGLSPVTFSPEQRRGGLLTEASILTLTAKNDSGLPIFRGRYVREAILCEALPPMPSDVPEIPEPVPGESDQARLDRHRSDPTCNQCHSRLEPVGFAFAGYDRVGAERVLDSTGAPVDARGSLDGWGTDGFDGPFELAQQLHDDPAVPRCLATQMFRHASGRRETDDDACALAEIEAELVAHDDSMQSLVLAIVRSPAFLERQWESP